jgi:Tol biopolymer transport system component
MRKMLLTVAGLAALTVSAQSFKIAKVEQVKTPAQAQLYHPVFSPDGKKLMVSSENFGGLAVIDLSTMSYKRVSTAEGAGYNAAMTADGTSVVIRDNNLEAQTMSLYEVNIATGARKTIARDIAHTNAVSISGHSVSFADEGRVKATAVASQKALGQQLATPANVFVTEEDLKMVVYQNNQRKVVDPLLTAKGLDLNYCWTHLSPNGKKLLFVAGNNCYTSNLDGSNLVNLGPLHAPQWRGNDWVVAMLDQDDDHIITGSEIVIVGANGANRQQLTSSKQVKMFPSVSPDGNRIAYHTLDGEVYILTITQK